MRFNKVMSICMLMLVALATYANGSTQPFARDLLLRTKNFAKEQYFIMQPPVKGLDIEPFHQPPAYINYTLIASSLPVNILNTTLPRHIAVEFDKGKQSYTCEVSYNISITANKLKRLIVLNGGKPFSTTVNLGGGDYDPRCNSHDVLVTASAKDESTPYTITTTFLY